MIYRKPLPTGCKRFTVKEREVDMLKNRNLNIGVFQRERLWGPLTAIAISVLFGIGFWTAIIYVAVHFIDKFW